LQCICIERGEYLIEGGISDRAGGKTGLVSYAKEDEHFFKKKKKRGKKSAV